MSEPSTADDARPQDRVPANVSRRGFVLAATGTLAVGVAGSATLYQLLDSRPATGPAVIDVLTGHSAAVSAVAFSPDGKVLASSSADATVRLWSMPVGKAVATLTGHTAAVNTLAFSHDGGTLATGSSDRTVRLWSMTADTSAAAFATLTGHSAAVRTLAFSSDGTILATGGDDRSTREWSMITDQDTATLTDQAAVVNAVAFGPDGSVLLTGYANSTVRFWNVSTNAKMGLLTVGGGDTSVNALAVAHSQLIAIGASPNGVVLWDGSGKGHFLATLPTKNIVNALAYHPDGRTLAGGMSDGTIQLWNTDGEKPIGAPLKGHRGEVTSVAFSPDGKMLASGSIDRTARLWRNLPSSAPAASASGSPSASHS